MPAIAIFLARSDTSDMPQLFEALLIALLVLIAVELFILLRALPRLAARLGLPPAEPGAPGQTINVNVGAVPVAGGVPAASAAADAEKALAAPAPAAGAVAEEPVEADPDEAAAREEMEDKRSADMKAREERAASPSRQAVARATTSGLIAKKCPACGMDNSTYRTECFNCGGRI